MTTLSSSPTPTTTGQFAQTTTEVALRAILAEVTPGTRPFSMDSYLPEHLVRLGQQALEPFSSSAPILITQIERQHAKEIALSTALWHVRHGTDQTSIQAATDRAMRAASMLKQACTETMEGRA